MRARDHVDRLTTALRGLDLAVLAEFAGRIVAVTGENGGRLLVAGNGGSAAQAQHLTAELVGRYVAERAPLSALALHAETSSLTAIGNDYGFEEIFARQIRAHGRPGDLLLLLSTSGASANLLAAAEAGREAGLEIWAWTGRAGNPLTQVVDQVLCVDSPAAATVQECHLVAIHALCTLIDDLLPHTRPMPLVAAPASALPRATKPDTATATASSVPAGDFGPPLVEQRAAREIVVVGDAFLDRDHVGVSRDGAAGPPIVDDTAPAQRPGGAGLAALLAARHPDMRVALITALGADRSGKLVRARLEAGGVEVVDLGLGGRTATKNRVIADGVVIGRYDEAQDLSFGPLGEAGEAALSGADAVLVADYGMGLADHVRTALERRAAEVPLVWDPHPNGGPPVRGAMIAAPNRFEAASMSGKPMPQTFGDDVRNAKHLRDQWQTSTIVLTRGSDGAIVHAADAPVMVVPADQPAHGDACGAGDCFAAELTAELARGSELTDAVEAAAVAAADYVRAGGPATIPSMPPRGVVPTGLPTTGPLSPWSRALRGGQASTEQTAGRPAASDADTVEAVAAVRRAGGRVVVTAGCFDVLHSGHVALLRRARGLGDFLVVCLNSDASIARLKGPSRPVVAGADRAAVLAGLQSVDAVMVFTEDTPHEVIRRLRPDVYVKGGDYTLADLPERELVESLGGDVVLLPYVDGRSTTKIIRDAAASAATAGEAAEPARQQPGH